RGGIGLERQVVEQPLLGLAHGDRAQHLLRLLGERDGRHHASEFGHREVGDRVLHLVERGTRQLTHLDRARHLECLVEALGEACTRRRSLLWRGRDVQPGGGRVVQLVERGEEGTAGRHAPRLYTIRPDAKPRVARACTARARLATSRSWLTGPAAWAIQSDGRCRHGTRRMSTAARSWAASSASSAYATAS